MNFVDPIRDPRKITQIKNLLKGQGRFRDLLLFVMGINMALRISDLLPLQIQDIYAEGKLRPYLEIRERKTNKRNRITFNQSIQDAWDLYLRAYPTQAGFPQGYLFFSTYRGSYRYDQPLQHAQGYNIISGICHEVGLTGNYGTHTLRKTWAYHARLSGVPMEIIMSRLNHSSFSVTKRYLGITDDELAELSRRLNL